MAALGTLRGQAVPPGWRGWSCTRSWPEPSSMARHPATVHTTAPGTGPHQAPSSCHLHPPLLLGIGWQRSQEAERTDTDSIPATSREESVTGVNYLHWYNSRFCFNRSHTHCVYLDTCIKDVFPNHTISAGIFYFRKQTSSSPPFAKH